MGGERVDRLVNKPSVRTSESETKKDEGWLANWLTVWQANKLCARMAIDTALIKK